MDKKESDINTKKKKKKYGKSFYVIFALCMISMVGAAWSAYSSVSDYMEPSVIETKPNPASHKEQDKKKNSTTATTQPRPDTANVANQIETALPTEEPSKEQATKAEETASYFYPVGDEILKEYSGITPVKSETFGDFRTHNGTDYKSKDGASVHMITTGTVKTIKSDEIMGGIVIAENNDGSTVTYCGVTPAEELKVGSHLSGGDVIGTVSEIASEKKDGPHIHIEIVKDGKPINPHEFLNNNKAH